MDIEWLDECERLLKDWKLAQEVKIIICLERRKLALNLDQE